MHFKFVASLMRRAANWIDPRPVAEAVTPLEFIGSDELAGEILRRSDKCLLFFGRTVDEQQIDGLLITKIPRSQLVGVLGAIERALTSGTADG